jgi:polyisoprenoid-binding protein YceI
MKMKFCFLITLFLISNLVFGSIKPIPVTSATIEWKGYKIAYERWGTIELERGELDFEEGTLTGGNFVVDMTSIEVTSLEGGKKASLEKHLRSDDFFGVEQYPSATMVITAVEQTESEYIVTGDFTIKGQTHPVIFPMTINGNKATAKVKIDRSKYNVRYGSDSFFDNLGNRVIYNEFDLNVTLIF